MSKKRLFAIAVCAAAVMGMGANAALAGEVNGKGEETPIGAAPETDPHASSICSFSGQNDGELPLGRTAEHVQSWGQIPKEVRDDIATEGSHPGDACNGHTGFFAGG